MALKFISRLPKHYRLTDDTLAELDRIADLERYPTQQERRRKRTLARSQQHAGRCR